MPAATICAVRLPARESIAVAPGSVHASPSSVATSAPPMSVITGTMVSATVSADAAAAAAKVASPANEKAIAYGEPAGLNVAVGIAALNWPAASIAAAA